MFPAALALAALLPAGGSAQSQADTAPRHQSLFVKSDRYLAAGFGAATLVLLPVDQRIATFMRDPRRTASDDLRRLSAVFRFLGGPGPYLVGGALYATGRLAHAPRVSDMAIHAIEGVVAGSAASGVTKLLLGRARPYVSADANPYDFSLGRGIDGNDFQSFPSGHTTAAFAMAAALATEAAAWWPRRRWILGPVLYGGAALVGLSRTYDDQHWASDIVLGAAIGTFAGRKTVRFHHDRLSPKRGQ